MSRALTLRTLAILLLSALACVGCKRRGSDDPVDPEPEGPGPGPACTSVDQRLDGPGVSNHASTVCAGVTDKYRINVGCNPGGAIGSTPACGACTLSGKLTYEGEADLRVLVFEENGGGTQVAASAESTSPKTASATVVNGGTMSVRVRHASGPVTPYDVEINYNCP